MKLLLDENLPIRLKYRFSSSVSVGTVSDEGWGSLKDKELLTTMSSRGYTILVTADRHLPYQQNLDNFDVVVMVLLSSDNRYQTLVNYVPAIESHLPPQIKRGVIEISLPQ